MTTIETSQCDSWSQALDAALEGGVSEAILNKDRTWVADEGNLGRDRGKGKGILVWNHPDFGTFSVSASSIAQDGQAEGFHAFDNRIEGKTSSSVKLFGVARPKEVTLKLSASLTKDVRLVNHFYGQIREMCPTKKGGDLKDLKVKVRWQGNNPDTRRTDLDNVDYVFVAPDGKFAHLQISLTTRANDFWVTIQEVYLGQIARTTLAKAKEMFAVDPDAKEAKSYGQKYESLGRGFVGLPIPLYAEFAHPRTNYFKNFGLIGPRIIELAFEDFKYSSPLSRCKRAVWKTPVVVEDEELRHQGFVPVVVYFFNIVIGWGFADIIGSDESAFCHFKNIRDRKGNRPTDYGDFPYLEPATIVWVQTESDPKSGKLKAAVITPAESH